MMNLIDMHCDTISKLMKMPKEQNLKQNNLCISMENMEKAGTMVQFFACFVYAPSYEQEKGTRQMEPDGQAGLISSEAWNRAYEAVLEMAKRIDNEQNEGLKTAYSYNDMIKNKNAGIISAVKTVEEGGVLNGDSQRLKTLYNAGVRLMTLTWNFPNCLGYPNSREKNIMEKGLTRFGLQTIEQMNELGIIIDVSHLSDGGFWDCLKNSKAPICASHSNARALCNHPRNLSDEMLKALGEKGGVSGLNFYPAFLREKGTAAVDDIACHAVHIIQTAGEDAAAIGTDFDGFDNVGDEHWIHHMGEMEKVWEAMKKRGITERQLDKIMSGNALRVIRSNSTSNNKQLI